MKSWLDPRRFSTRLLLVFLGLILLTTLSAGIPAYLLTRTELEAQAWLQVQTGQQATRSLLAAEQERLENLANLLAERPTLQALVISEDWATLTPYLQAFQQQSKLDILVFCHANQREIIALPPLTACPSGTGFTFLADQPVLLANHPVFSPDNRNTLGTVVIGLWLNDSFVAHLADNTGMLPTIILPDGTRFVSQLGDSATTLSNRDIPIPNSYVLSTANDSYYATLFPLTEEGLQMELALPVAGLLITERRALTILVVSTGLVAFIGIDLGAWLIRRLTAPLHELTAAAEQISQGDFVTPIPTLTGPVEVTTLAQALDKSHTTMRHALDELAQARDWFHTLIQSIVEGVVTFDTHGQITFLSQGAERLTGWRSDEVRGRAINTLFRLPPDQSATFIDLIPPPGQQRQIEVLTASGKTIILAVTGARHIPPHSHTVQVALVLRDVTQEAAWHNLSAYFLANITHEFRTPLSTLSASIELMLDESENFSPAEMRELLKPTYLSLLTLQTLIDNLLESSRLEAGQFKLRSRPTEINQVLADAVRIVQPLLERRQQTLTLAESAQRLGYEFTLMADSARLTQVVVNLLTNASKYSPQNSEIEVQIGQHDTTLRLAVADRGAGIPPTERINLFRRFVRLDGPEGEQYGVGLGLYVVKHTVEAHRGRVGVEDRPGGGSVFWVELPLEKEIERVRD